MLKPFDDGLYGKNTFWDLTDFADISCGKLQYLNLCPVSVSLIASYLDNRHQLVKNDTVIYVVLKVQNGVSQGSVMDPLLSTVFVNDIFHKVDSCKPISFVEDVNKSNTGSL